MKLTIQLYDEQGKVSEKIYHGQGEYVLVDQEVLVGRRRVRLVVKTEPDDGTPLVVDSSIRDHPWGEPEYDLGHDYR